MTDKERIANLEQRTDKQERNIKDFAQAIKALMESSLHHSEMMNDFFRGLNSLRETVGELRSAQANTDAKIAALVDAQIKAEDEIAKLREGQANTDIRVAALVDAQIKAEDAMAGLRAAQSNTDGKITVLVDAQIKAEDEMKEMREKVNMLVDAQIRAEDKMKEMREGMAELRGIVKDIARLVKVHIEDPDAHKNRE